MISKQKLGLNSNFAKQLLHYALFYFGVWIIHLLVISFIAFFHFLLEHPLDIIENWIFTKGWEIISLTKIIGGFVILRLITLKIDSRQPMREIFVRGFVWPRSELFVIVVFLITFFVFFGKPELVDRTRIEYVRMAFSFIGIIVFYMVDLFVIDSLEQVYPIESRFRWVSLLIYPVVIFAISRQIFWYGEEINFLVLFNLLLCLALWQWRQRNWSQPFVYICLFVAPAGVLLGVDPIWGAAFSPLKLSASLRIDQYLIILLIVLGYLFYRKKRITQATPVGNNL
jgi:hypothetical protein